MPAGWGPNPTSLSLSEQPASSPPTFRGRRAPSLAPVATTARDGHAGAHPGPCWPRRRRAAALPGRAGGVTQPFIIPGRFVCSTASASRLPGSRCLLPACSLRSVPRCPRPEHLLPAASTEVLVCVGTPGGDTAALAAPSGSLAASSHLHPVFSCRGTCLQGAQRPVTSASLAVPTSESPSPSAAPGGSGN